MTPPPDLTTNPRAQRVVKRPIDVPVTFAIREDVIQTLEGPVTVRPGDAILTGVQGERWPIRRDPFLASYTPVTPTISGQDGLYRKNPSITLALRLDKDLQVPVGWQPDALQAHPGDWLLRYEDGSNGVIQDAIFQKTYSPADTD